MNSIKKSFGNRKHFAIECEIDLTEKEYLFSKMSFYACNHKINNDNNAIFVLSMALSYISIFLEEYEERGYVRKILGKYLIKGISLEDSFSKLISKQQDDLIQHLDDNKEINNELYDDLDNAFLDFEWEPFAGYMLHFFEYKNNSYLLWDENKCLLFSSCIIPKGKFYTVLKEFHVWASKIIDGEKMSFSYTQEWADELLHLYSLEYTDGDEEERIYELIEMTEGSNDVRVAKVLIECLCISINGIDERIKSMFTTMSFEVYYEALFSSVRLYIKDWGEELGPYFSVRLDDWYARKLTQEELETVVFPMAKKYLTKKDIKNAIKVMEESNVLGDSPIDEFYAFFNKELDANWTPPRQEEVEPMSEEETQKYKDEVQKMSDEITKSLED